MKFQLFSLDSGFLFCNIASESSDRALLGYQNDGEMKHFYFLFMIFSFE